MAKNKKNIDYKLLENEVYVKGMKIDFESWVKKLKSKKVDFYGVSYDPYIFKIGLPGSTDTICLAVMEDPNDGYRSSMEHVVAVPDPGIFQTSPAATLKISMVSDYLGGLFSFEDDKKYVWFAFGTDDSDNYYPSFVFRYTPPIVHHLPAVMLK